MSVMSHVIDAFHARAPLHTLCWPPASVVLRVIKCSLLPSLKTHPALAVPLYPLQEADSIQLLDFRFFHQKASVGLYCLTVDPHPLARPAHISGKFIRPACFRCFPGSNPAYGSQAKRPETSH